ncbi:MAG: TonB-dependent receptor [Bacteroidales bacterium]|nr:TonB-dependent receptor [Bacteroidales bacterium]
MRIFFALWLLLGLVYTARSQIITITDIESGNPIETVTLISESPKEATTTNDKGQADISLFKESRKITISHLAYKPAEYSYKQLELLNFKVELTTKILSLQEVSVTVNRWEQMKIETPSRVTSINLKEASFQNPQTAADLLGTSGYVFIQKSQLGGGSPMLRGMATNRVLLVVDGVRMNNAIFRSGNLQNVISLDANALEGTEIIFGPGSVMYGSDAIGGVMSFETLKPKFSLNDSKKPMLTGNAMTRFSSANTEKTVHFDMNVGFKKLAFVSSFTYANYGDLRSGSVGGVPYFYRTNYVISYDNKDYMVPNEDSTLQIGSKYSQIIFMQKIRYQPNKYWDIDYGFHFSETSKYNRYDRLYVMRTDGPYKEKLRWAEWYYGPQKWQMHRLGITYSRKNIIFDKMQLIAAYQFFEESRYDREFMYRELKMQKENVDAYSINLDFDKKINDKITLYYGYEFVHNTIQSVASLTHVESKEVVPTVTRYPDGSSWQSNGVYLTAKYKVHKKWLITGGIRYNHFLIKADFDTTFFPFPFTDTRMSSGSISGSLGCVFTPTEDWQIYLNAANGFRAPNVDDMGKVFESVPGYLVVPNPDLKPEKVYNLELGTVKSFGTFLKLDATFYYTWLVDAMVRKNFTLNGDTSIRYLGNKSRIQAIQNVTKINVYGVQAGIEFYYKGFGLRSYISYQKGEEQTPDTLVFYPLRHAAPTFGSTHLTYEYRNKFKAEFYVVYNRKMDYKDLALTERTNASYARDEQGRAYVKGWYTLNFKLAYFPNPFIAITAGIENIMDLMYRPYASGINAPGRNLIISLKFKF